VSRPPLMRWGVGLLLAGTILLVAAALVSYLVSPDRGASLPWVILVVLGAAYLLAVLALLTPDRAARITPTRLAGVEMGLGLAVTLTFLFSTRWLPYKLAFLSGVYSALPSVRSLGISWLDAGIQPNQAGGMTATFVAMAFALLLVPGLRLRLPWAQVLAVVGLAVVVLAGSRAALAGLAVATIVLLIARDRRWLWVPPALAGILAALAVVWPATLSRLAGLLMHDETLDTKLVARLDIWISAFRGIQDHAITGIGLGVFNQVMPIRYPYETVGLSYSVSQAHNVFLDTALTLGLPGLLSLLLLFSGMLLLTWFVIRNEGPERPLRPLAFGLVAAIIVFVVFGMTDALSLSTPSALVIWWWASMVATISHLLLHEQSSRALDDPA
jgi:O-antigen ligase